MVSDYTENALGDQQLQAPSNGELTNLFNSDAVEENLNDQLLITSGFGSAATSAIGNYAGGSNRASTRSRG